MRIALLLSLFSLTFTNELCCQKKSDLFYCYQMIPGPDKLESYGVEKIITALELGSNDTLLSIGAAGSYLEFLIPLYKEGIVFHLEDIDSTCLNKNNVEGIRSYISELHKTQIDFKYELLYGNEKSTTLKANTYDNILIAKTFHHFTYQNQMLTDLRKVLRKDGTIYLIESVAKKEGTKHPGCKDPMMMEKELKSLLNANKLTIESSTLLKENRKFYWKLFKIKIVND